MDKKNDHEEMDKMPIPQKKEDTTFADFVSKNKEIIYKMAKSNTVVNESGLTVIQKTILGAMKKNGMKCTKT